MTHAPRDGRRRFDPSAYDTDAPIGALAVRDELANNAMHAADEACAKVLVNVKASDSSLITGTPQTYITGDLEATGVWYRIASYGPFGLSVFEDRTPYQIVCEVYAASSAASAVGIAIEVSANLVGEPREIVYATGRNSIKWTTSSTTPAWLSPVGGSNIIVPTPEVFLPPFSYSTTDVAGGSPREILMCDFFVNVFGIGTVGVAEPRIHGMLVREYVGK